MTKIAVDKLRQIYNLLALLDLRRIGSGEVEDSDLQDKDIKPPLERREKQRHIPDERISQSNFNNKVKGNKLAKIRTA